ncbi:hypothetical protein DYB26_009662 [Aphanomyces astaci]|uniref:Amino acid transporter transmembrane domain-containing protein n=3 Tax=Aphanomyces astaci TaxID=112090 RepID=A0A397FIP9_APHAT|nr:hypothetical protein DYB26_009662 [Aphanomyces astaci]RHZ26059.1 hypothetical protein DYB31_009554 [Aphanomyces astaci]
MFSLHLPSKQDVLVIIHLTACVCGVGSLSMPYIFAQAGPTYSTMAFVLNCFFNTYATVALSHCFLKLRHVPHIHTYTDLAVHLWGQKGAYVVQATQLASCFLLPVAFLVLGGTTLLPVIFDGAIDISTTVWIILMAVVLLPIIYIRVLHEAYIVLITGALATIIGDIIATIDAYVAHGDELYEPTDNIRVTHVLDTFGSFALAYGAAVVVPQLQHHHPQPEKMPTALVYGMLLISGFYVTLGALGYAHFGCASPSNLLLAMTHTSQRRRAAYIAMQMHISIAFAVFLNPFFVTVEKTLFPISAAKDDAADARDRDFAQIETPKVVPGLDDAQTSAEGAKYSETVRRYIFRTLIVASQCFLAMLTQSSFSDVADLAGASVMNFCSVTLPLMLYYKLFKAEMSKPHKILCWFVIVASILLGTYSTIQAIGRIFKNASKYTLFASTPPSKRTEYAYCPAGYTDRKAQWLDSFSLYY